MSESLYIDNKKTIQSQIGLDNGIGVFLAYPAAAGSKDIVFFDAADPSVKSQFELTGLQPTQLGFNCEYLASRNELIVVQHTGFSGSGPLTITRYGLTGTPLPTAAEVLETKQFGSLYSFATNIQRLDSSTIMVTYFTGGLPPVYSGTVRLWPVEYGFLFYKNEVWTQINKTVSGRNSPTVSRMAIARHPTDGTVWVFAHRDSYPDTYAFKFRMSAGNVWQLNSTDEQFLSKARDGVNALEGEYPWIEAFPDPSGDRILLAYESNTYKYFATKPIVKGAHITVCAIDQAGVKTFTTAPFWFDRLSQFGLYATQDKFFLWGTVVDATLDQYRLFFTEASRATGVWTEPVFVLDLPRTPITNAPSLPFVLVGQGTKGAGTTSIWKVSLDVAAPAFSVDQEVELVNLTGRIVAIYDGSTTEYDVVLPTQNVLRLTGNFLAEL